MKGKSRAVIVGMAAVLTTRGIVMNGANAQSTAASAPKTAVQQFKNIQVLKDIPGDQLFPAMQFITASLGVECEFCHVQGAFEKDDKKPKQTARKMMEMMITINQENFDGKREVTCYSCHRGSINPVATPVVMTADSKPVMAEPREIDEAQAKETGRPTADILFDKYVKAVGGTAAIEKITSRVMKATTRLPRRHPESRKVEPRRTRRTLRMTRTARKRRSRPRIARG